MMIYHDISWSLTGISGQMWPITFYTQNLHEFAPFFYTQKPAIKTALNSNPLATPGSLAMPRDSSSLRWFHFFQQKWQWCTTTASTTEVFFKWLNSNRNKNNFLNNWIYDSGCFFFLQHIVIHWMCTVKIYDSCVPVFLLAPLKLLVKFLSWTDDFATALNMFFVFFFSVKLPNIFASISRPWNLNKIVLRISSDVKIPVETGLEMAWISQNAQLRYTHREEDSGCAGDPVAPGSQSFAARIRQYVTCA